MRHGLLLGLCLGVFIQSNLANGFIFDMFQKKPACNCSSDSIKITGNLEFNQFLKGFLSSIAEKYNQLVNHVIPPKESKPGIDDRYDYEIVFKVYNRSVAKKDSESLIETTTSESSKKSPTTTTTDSSILSKSKTTKKSTTTKKSKTTKKSTTKKSTTKKSTTKKSTTKKSTTKKSTTKKSTTKKTTTKKSTTKKSTTTTKSPIGNSYSVFVTLIKKYLNEQNENNGIEHVEGIISKIIALNIFLNNLLKIDMIFYFNKNFTTNYDSLKANFSVGLPDIERHANASEAGSIPAVLPGSEEDTLPESPNAPNAPKAPKVPLTSSIILTLIQNYLSTQTSGDPKIEDIIDRLKEIISIVAKFNQRLGKLIRLEIRFRFGKDAKQSRPGLTRLVVIINDKKLNGTDYLDKLGLPPQSPDEPDQLPVNPDRRLQVSPLLLIAIHDLILTHIDDVEAASKFSRALHDIITKATFLNLLIDDWINVNLKIKLNRVGDKNATRITEFKAIPISPKPKVKDRDKFGIVFENIQDIITKVTRLNKVLKGIFTIDVNFKSIESPSKDQPKHTRITLVVKETKPAEKSVDKPKPPKRIPPILLILLKRFLQHEALNKRKPFDPNQSLKLQDILLRVIQLNQLIKDWLKIDIQISLPGQGNGSIIHREFDLLPGDIKPPKGGLLPIKPNKKLPKIHPIIRLLLQKYLIAKNPNKKVIKVIMEHIQNLLLRMVQLNQSIRDKLKIDIKFKFPDKTNQNSKTRLIIVNEEPKSITKEKNPLDQFNILLWINEYLLSINRARPKIQAHINYLPPKMSLILPYLYVVSSPQGQAIQIPPEIAKLYGGFDLSNSLFRELMAKLKMDITGKVQTNVKLDINKIFTPGDLISGLIRGGIRLEHINSRPASSLFGIISYGTVKTPKIRIDANVHFNNNKNGIQGILNGLIPTVINQRTVEDKPLKLSGGDDLLDKITHLGHHVLKRLEKDGNNTKVQQQLAKAIHESIHAYPLQV